MNQCVVAGLGNIYVNEICIFVKSIPKNWDVKLKIKILENWLVLLRKHLKMQL